MDKSLLEVVNTVTSILVHLTVLVGAAIAAVKFKLFKILDHRYRSEFRASHTDLGDGHVLLEGDYVIHNAGDRPITITRVELRVYGAKHEGAQVVVDRDRELAARVVTAADPGYAGLMEISAGEKGVYALRCRVPGSEGMVFVSCRFEWPYRRKPASYLSLYVYKRGQTFVV